MSISEARGSAIIDEVSPPANAPSPQRKVRTRSGLKVSWWFLLPALVFYLFVTIVPSARGFVYSFTDWNGVRPVINFVGLDNYAKIFTDPAAFSSIGNTLLFAIAITILQNGIGLALALGANTLIKSRNVLRVVFFAPAVLTSVVTAFVWKFIFAPDGPLNTTLASVGLGNLQHDWLGDATTAQGAVIFSTVWQFSGYSMVIFLAGLQGIPEEIYEAAAVDGAGVWRRFVSIVRPLLAPAITVNLMLSIIGGLKTFDQILVLTDGGPGNSTATIASTIYKNAFSYGQFSYGIALAVILTIGVAIVSAIQYRLLAQQENR
ncbi:carbohydrate ABC transporter permease [Kribbella sp. CA-245084]|uniref:carbohydrate ABC transporter permease n=1 Tax=Kribbella sp. CA-245084 TaxID=3239940 RepID=UPI003D8B6927